MKFAATLLTAVVGLAAAMPVDEAAIERRGPPGKFDPSIVPAEYTGHNPKGAAKNANSNIKAQKDAGKAAVGAAKKQAEKYRDDPKTPKGKGKGVDYGNFNPNSIRD